MKAITICQPYAELIARGEKPIENRTWDTRYRGWLLIHAGKSREWLEPDDERLYQGMAFGAVVAVAKLVACLHLHRPETWPAYWLHLRDHEHANGPWCWILRDVRRLREPVPWRGAQGLWPYDTRLGDAVRAQLTPAGQAVASGARELPRVGVGGDQRADPEDDRMTTLRPTEAT